MQFRAGMSITYKVESTDIVMLMSHRIGLLPLNKITKMASCTQHRAGMLNTKQ